MKVMRIGDVLTARGYVTKEQLHEALNLQQQKKSQKRIGELLVELKYLDHRDHLRGLGEYLGLEVIDLKTYPIDAAAVAMIPREIARKYGMLAVSRSGGRLLVVTGDPTDLNAVEDVRLVTGMAIDLALAEKEETERAIGLHYAEIETRNAADRASKSAAPLSDGALDNMLAGVDEANAPIVRLLNSLLVMGYNTNISDIHIEPCETQTVVRMRRDGMLLPYMTLSVSLHQGLVARTKIMAQMDIAEKRRPQDGHFRLCLDGGELNVRVSFMPTVHGEKGVLRFLSKTAQIDHNDTFGMNGENYARMMKLLQAPHGLIYFTGPTGSGKTTTLYLILEYLKKRPVNIVTIEDPVERTIEGVSQTQVNERAGVTFDSALRSMLRQDPDIIMVGETRDLDTASIAARAAITGHLVLSTLHTNNAVSSVLRLKDMGLPAYVASGSLTGVVAQRLVRKICPSCKIEYEAGVAERHLLFGSEFANHGDVRLFRGTGCRQCGETGYLGRVAIHEILGIDQQLRLMIQEGRPEQDLENYAKIVKKMPTMKDEAINLVLSGVTTVEELQKVSYSIL